MVSRSIYPVKSQQFSFPSPLMSHIYINRTAILHSKLIKSCKYFFAKEPIIVVKSARIGNENLNFEEESNSLCTLNIKLADFETMCFSTSNVFDSSLASSSEHSKVLIAFRIASKCVPWRKSSGKFDGCRFLM